MIYTYVYNIYYRQRFFSTSFQAHHVFVHPSSSLLLERKVKLYSMATPCIISNFTSLYSVALKHIIAGMKLSRLHATAGFHATRSIPRRTKIHDPLRLKSVGNHYLSISRKFVFYISAKKNT